MIKSLFLLKSDTLDVVLLSCAMVVACKYLVDVVRNFVTTTQRHGLSITRTNGGIGLPNIRSGSSIVAITSFAVKQLLRMIGR